jgi:DNA polymerase-3 subunit delta
VTPPAPAYLVTGDDPALVAEELAELLGRITAGAAGGGGGGPILVEEHGPTSAGSRSAARHEDEVPPGDSEGTAGRARIELGPVLDACTTPPFLADRRVVVLRHAGLLDAQQVKLVVAYLESPLESTSLVLVADEKAASAPLERAVKAKGVVVDARVGSGAKARSSWLDAHLHQASVKLTPPAKALLDHHLGDELARVPGLLATLTAAYGEGARVGPEELEPFLGEAGAGKPWELTDAIDAGDGRGAVAVLHGMLAGGERHSLVVLSTLHRHFGAMLRLDGSGATSDAAAADLLRMKPFPAGKALRQARKLGHDQIVRAITLLADADLDLRGRSGLPPELVLEVLVARLAQLVRSAGRTPAVSRRS